MKELQFYPLALLGNFQRYGVLRLGKFPNKLRYFLRKYPAACRLPARLPFGYGCPCRLLARNPTLFFPFRSVGGGAVGYKVFPINTLAAKREEDLSGNGVAT